MKFMQIQALKNGTVIDKIPPKNVIKVLEVLDLVRCDTEVAVGINFSSKTMGKKGFVKISDKFLTENELERLTVFAPDAVLNIIKDYKVSSKKKLSAPKEINDMIRCNNPNCITNFSRRATRFHVLESRPIKLRCHYCEKIMSDDIKLR